MSITTTRPGLGKRRLSDPSAHRAPSSPPARSQHQVAPGLDNWPRTKRPLPWLIAAFLAMVWLMPFDTISMSVSLPFDLHLDRIVLPFIILAWGLAIGIGGVRRPASYGLTAASQGDRDSSSSSRLSASS